MQFTIYARDNDGRVTVYEEEGPTQRYVLLKVREDKNLTAHELWAVFNNLKQTKEDNEEITIRSSINVSSHRILPERRTELQQSVCELE